MSLFSQLTGSEFGKLRTDMQQGFHGGSFSEGGRSAIKAADPLISKERLANVLNTGVGGGNIFDTNEMDKQAGAANTAGQLYSLYSLGGAMGGESGGGAEAAGGTSGGTAGGAGSSAGGWSQYASMGSGMGGGQGQGQGNNDTQQQLQRETSDYMQKRREEEDARRREEESARRMAEVLRNGNGY